MGLWLGVLARQASRNHSLLGLLLATLPNLSPAGRGSVSPRPGGPAVRHIPAATWLTGSITPKATPGVSGPVWLQSRGGGCFFGCSLVPADHDSGPPGGLCSSYGVGFPTPLISVAGVSQVLFKELGAVLTDLGQSDGEDLSF